MSRLTKKDIFARKIDGKPIELIMMTKEDRQRYNETRELFYETGVFVRIESDDDGHDTRLTHELHIVVPRGVDPYLNKLEPMRFTLDAYGENNYYYIGCYKHFLP